MHYCVYVFIPQEGDVECLLAQALDPYSDSLEVAPYKVHLDEGELAAMATHFGIRRDDMKALAGKIEDWSGVPGGIDSDGLFKIVTWNPNGKFDGYEMGGRWDGFIPGNMEISRALLTKPNLKEILPDRMVTPDGYWHERETFISEGWSKWRVEKNQDNEWLGQVKKALVSHSHHRIVCVDMHS